MEQVWGDGATLVGEGGALAMSGDNASAVGADTIPLAMVGAAAVWRACAGQPDSASLMQ